MDLFKDLTERPNGSISNAVFSAETYERELEQVFGRCWLFLGHESMIPKPNDYFTNFMGIDGVIVQRDDAGRIRVYLNKCRHRGNEVCIYEAGNASSFTCAYHGWTYVNGALTGMPFAKEAYGDDIDRAKLGLVEVPRIATLGGLIFGCWDAGVRSLDDYLGDAKWYLENFLLREDIGGLEVVPGAQKYMMPVNWKLLAENFAGDHYHFYSAHASVLRLLSQSRDQRIKNIPTQEEKRQNASADFCIAANFGKGAAHGFVDLRVGSAFFEQDCRQAASLGKEAADWVTERHRRLEESLRRYKTKPYGFQAANIFPNFALIGVGTALYGKGLILHHPRGPEQTEAWMWCAVEKNAPKVVKETQKFVLMQRQAAAGMVAPDDHEIFLRIGNNLRAPVARQYDFHYGMGMAHDREDPRPPEFRDEECWPGLVVPRFSEAMQRDFYRCWSELMDAV